MHRHELSILHVYRRLRSKKSELSFVGVAFFTLNCVLLNSPAKGQSLNLNPNNLMPHPVPKTVNLAGPQTPPPAADLETQDLENAEIDLLTPGEVSPIAHTSGVSTPSGTTAPVFANRSYIANIVTFNPFQPPDLITANGGPVGLEPLRVDQPWSISVRASSSLNYDSNITRTSGSPQLTDGYLHSEAGVQSRFGTNSDPIALTLSYDYTADLFDRYRQFDTYTHNFSFSSRIGRSAFVWVPYAVGRFSSVESQIASDSGRQSYNFLVGGVHGENSYYPDLVHVYNLSYTSVSYPALTGADFGIWDLSQQVYFKPQYPTGRFLQGFEFYPWLELKRTVPDDLEPVDEINGGVGASVTLADHLILQAEVGWGNVSSEQQRISSQPYSGFRYDTSLVYRPFRYLAFSTHAQRVVTFTPQVVSEEVDEVDAAISFPLNFGPKFSLTPALAFYHAENAIGQNLESFYFQPSVTAAFKIGTHLAIFGKFQYSGNFSNDPVGATELGSGQFPIGIPINHGYTQDAQGSAGFTSLF
jgi:hypothetical protein